MANFPFTFTLQFHRLVLLFNLSPLDKLSIGRNTHLKVLFGTSNFFIEYKTNTHPPLTPLTRIHMHVCSLQTLKTFAEASRPHGARTHAFPLNVRMCVLFLLGEHQRQAQGLNTSG